MSPGRDAPEVRRPRAHITAPRNWLNDPNGLVFHGGRWHVFYQHNPDAPRWGPPWWGHVSSDDLAHWFDHPPALRPRPDGPDRDGCWSGCVRVVGGVPTAFYTGVVGEGPERVEAVCVATGDNQLETWVQHDRPVIAGPPPGLGTGYHRDPFVFGSPGAWRMLIGSGLGRDQRDGGAILHYRSSDLRSWSYEGVLWHRLRRLGPIDTGPLWECPQVVRIGDDDVLIFSVNFEGEPEQLRYCLAAVGRLSEGEFTPRTIRRLDYGNSFYAPAVLEEGDGRILIWGWAQERHDLDDVDHAGALSIPRVLSLDEGEPTVTPAPQLGRLHAAAIAADHIGVEGLVLPEWPSFDLAALAPKACMGLALTDGDGVVLYSVTLVRAEGVVAVRSGRNADVLTGPMRMEPDAPAPIRLVVDASLVELYVGGVAFTTRLYERTPAGLRSLGPDPLRALRIDRLDDAFG